MNIWAGRNSGELDSVFGRLRGPSEVNEWENGRAPHSLVVLDAAVSSALLEYRRVCQASLLIRAAQAFAFIWAMDVQGHIVIACEELSDEALEYDGEVPHQGYPRRRGIGSHPVEKKKLGHPTLVSCGQARVAGELYLDIDEGNLFWFVNCSSGRYCRQVAPSTSQQSAVHQLFMELLDNDVRWDNVDG